MPSPKQSGTHPCPHQYTQFNSVWSVTIINMFCLTVSDSWGLRFNLRKRKATTGTMQMTVAKAIVNHTTGCANVFCALPMEKQIYIAPLNLTYTFTSSTNLKVETSQLDLWTSQLSVL